MRTRIGLAFICYFCSQSTIYIASGHHDVATFVDTIVHELVHAMQYRKADVFSDRLPALNTTEIEKEADKLGAEAMLEYKKENNIPIWA